MNELETWNGRKESHVLHFVCCDDNWEAQKLSVPSNTALASYHMLLLPVQRAAAPHFPHFFCPASPKTGSTNTTVSTLRLQGQLLWGALCSECMSYKEHTALSGWATQRQSKRAPCTYFQQSQHFSSSARTQLPSSPAGRSREQARWKHQQHMCADHCLAWGWAPRSPGGRSPAGCYLQLRKLSILVLQHSRRAVPATVVEIMRGAWCGLDASHLSSLKRKPRSNFQVTESEIPYSWKGPLEVI